jgi:hypothetical protein
VRRGSARDRREILARPHRRAEDRELLPPDAVQRGRRIRAGCRAADRDAASGSCDGEGRLPRRLADVLDHDVGTASAGRLLHGFLHVAGGVVHRRVGAELARTSELRVARGGHDHAGPERLGDRERSGRDTAADPPREHPLALLQAGARHEHPVGGLEDERKRRRLLEAQAVGDRVDVRRRHGDQLGVRAVSVLADHVDPAVADLDPGIDDDGGAGLEARHARAERLHDAGSVGAEDARLRHRRKAPADPDVEMVQRGGAEADEHLGLAGDRVGHLLEHEHLGAAVLVDPNRAHRGRLSA